jgi:flagellin
MRIGNFNQNPYEQLSTMKKINRASDNPADFAISQKLTSQTNGYNKGVENAASMNDLANTAESALSSVNETLTRIKELAIQASNGTMTQDDRKIVQTEINALKSSIQDVSNNTEFNTQKLLNGSFTNKKTASTPSGNGLDLSINDSGLKALGIEKFDVTGDFKLEDIDNAISKISESRADLGATSNRLTTEISINEVASENLTAANSNITDTDIEKAMIELNSQKILQQYQYFSQKQSTALKAGAIDMLG